MSPEDIGGPGRFAPAAGTAAGDGWAGAADTGFMPEGSMRHEWIFDVLTDLKDYALLNGLPDLASSVELALVSARREVAALELADTTLSPDAGRQTH